MATPRPLARCKTDAGILLLAWLAVSASCRQQEPAAVELARREDLTGPAWRVAARRDGKVLLALQRATRRAEGSPTLIFENGRHRQGPDARITMIPLRAGERPDTLRLQSLMFDGETVLYARAGDGPVLYQSPVEPRLYVAEHGNHLWLVTAAGATRLTADTVQGIARDTLRAQQREGVRHLFWAATPLWSPDGSAIAYVTNRTWMLNPRGGQEVWIVEPQTGRERPLLSEPGEFFSPQGWLGSELVYQPRQGPISAIDVRSGKRRAIASGAVVAISPSASRMLYMVPVGDTAVRAHVVTERNLVVDVPDLPTGQRFDYRGAFSPSGDCILLGTSFARDSGITRALYVFDVGARRLTRLMQWSHREGNRHPDGSPGAWLDESTLLLTQFDRNTRQESSMLVRLRPATSSRN